MFGDLFSWLLLPAGVALGWALARRGGRFGQQQAEAAHNEAVGGHGNRFHDDADAAIAALTRAIEAEPGAVELRLTLGSLFRKRGEIDRAMRLHEALLDNPGLTLDQSAQGRLELARDYLKAGVIDRAEALAQSLLDSGVLAGDALDLLLDLYEQTRDWTQAIATAQRWQAVRGRSAATRLAQYHCELSEVARDGNDPARAIGEAEAALAADHTCIRALMLIASIEEKRGRPAEAFASYARALEQSPAYAVELLPPLQRCATAARMERQYGELLDEWEQKVEMPMAVLLAKTQWLVRRDGAEAAAAYLAQRLAQRPDWEGLLQWIDLAGAGLTGQPGWAPLQASLRKRLAAQPRYQCAQCGFRPSVPFWQCPSCKSWATVKPIP